MTISNQNLEQVEGHQIAAEMSESYEFWRITQQTIEAAQLEAQQFTLQYDVPLNVRELVAYALIGISEYPTVLRCAIDTIPQAIRPNREDFLRLSHFGIINYANLSGEVSLGGKRPDIVVLGIVNNCPAISTIVCVSLIEGLVEELAEHIDQWYTTHKLLEHMMRGLIRSSLIITMENIDQSLREDRARHITDIFSLIRSRLDDFPPINASFIERIASPFPLAYAINAISSSELKQALQRAGFQIAHTEGDTEQYHKKASDVIKLMNFAITRGSQRAGNNRYQQLGIGVPHTHLPSDIVANEALQVLNELGWKWLQHGDKRMYSQEPGRWQRETLRKVPDLETIREAERLLKGIILFSR